MQLDIEQVEPDRFFIRAHEIALLDCLCLGLSSKEIAQRLGLADHTVKNKASRLGRYFGINVKRRHLNIMLVNYWNCELFRKGLSYSSDSKLKSLRHKRTQAVKRIARLKNRLENEEIKLLLLNEEYKQLSNSDVVDRRPTVCQVG